MDDDLALDLVLVGRIARPHGLRGQVVIDPETDFVDERFAPGATVLWRGAPPMQDARQRQDMPLKTLRIASSRVHRGRPIVSFEGVDTIEQAEALGRADLWIPAASRPELPAGQFYHDALIGCRVETTTGEVVGTVVRIDGGVGVALLVIEPESDEAGTAAASAATTQAAPRARAARRDEVLVPLAEAICPVIDPVQRRIVIDPPDGLIDVNR